VCDVRTAGIFSLHYSYAKSKQLTTQKENIETNFYVIYRKNNIGTIELYYSSFKIRFGRIQIFFFFLLGRKKGNFRTVANFNGSIIIF